MTQAEGDEPSEAEIARASELGDEFEARLVRIGNPLMVEQPVVLLQRLAKAQAFLVQTLIERGFTTNELGLVVALGALEGKRVHTEARRTLNSMPKPGHA